MYRISSLRMVMGSMMCYQSLWEKMCKRFHPSRYLIVGAILFLDLRIKNQMIQLLIGMGCLRERDLILLYSRTKQLSLISLGTQRPDMVMLHSSDSRMYIR